MKTTTAVTTVFIGVSLGIIAVLLYKKKQKKQNTYLPRYKPALILLKTENEIYSEPGVYL